MGLEKTAYNVSEDVGEVEVCVVARNTSGCYVPLHFSINIMTVDGSAGACIYSCDMVTFHINNSDTFLLFRIYQWK